MKVYRYYFNGIDKPIMIEAKSKYSARNTLEEICNTPKYRDNGYAIPLLVKETCETLVEGVSVKDSKHGILIWSKQGWVIKKHP